MSQEPTISVGIVRNKKFSFVLFGDFTTPSQPNTINGICTAELKNNKISCSAGGKRFESAGEVIFTPSFSQGEYFSIKDVIIGVQFHWERKEKESFRGALKLVIDKDALYAINIVPLEEYLKSVISSEMSPKSSINLLKAHSVVSRSW